jgi:hypothetical protein
MHQHMEGIEAVENGLGGGHTERRFMFTRGMQRDCALEIEESGSRSVGGQADWADQDKN